MTIEAANKRGQTAQSKLMPGASRQGRIAHPIWPKQRQDWALETSEMKNPKPNTLEYIIDSLRTVSKSAPIVTEQLKVVEAIAANRDIAPFVAWKSLWAVLIARPPSDTESTAFLFIEVREEGRVAVGIDRSEQGKFALKSGELVTASNVLPVFDRLFEELKNKE